MAETRNRRPPGLGCNGGPRNPYHHEGPYGADQGYHVTGGVTYVQANPLINALPFEGNYFDSARASDFIGQMPRQLPPLDTGKTRLPSVELTDNEIWRGVKPNGTFYAVRTNYPATSAFQVPAHANPITQGTHGYFCGDAPFAARYGFKGTFEKPHVGAVALKTTPTAEKSTAKSPCNLEGRMINPHRLGHLLWGLKAEKPFWLSTNSIAL